MKTLYFYRNDKGYLSFQNQKPFHTDKVHLAYASGKINTELIQAGYELEKLSIDDFQKIYAPIVSEILVIGDLLIRKYKDYNENFPTIPGDHKLIRNSVRNAISKMGEFHKQIDEILKSNQTQHDDFYESQGNLDELITLIAENLRSKKTDGITDVFKAYLKDPKAIEGIAKKTLKK
jgi:hypothetical protein